MSWFRKRSDRKIGLDEKERQVNIEVSQHKQKAAKVAKETQQVTDRFRKVLGENGITIKIHRAIGGNHGN